MLEVTNPDSAGVAIHAISEGKNGVGIKSELLNSEFGQTLKAFEGILNQSSFGGTTTYGAYLDIRGTSPTGIYAKALTTYTGQATGGRFEATSSDNFAIGISAIADGNFNYASKGGTFQTNGRSGIGVEGIATQASGGGVFNATNKGGYFTSAGNAGYGVHGIASNETTQELTYGGYFESMGEKGMGVFGKATGGAGNLDHYGGYFEALGNRGTGVYVNADSIGAKIDVDGPAGIQLELTGSQTGAVKALEAKANLSTFDINNVYGGYFDVTGRAATGLFAKATTQSGLTTGGRFESTSFNSGAIGITATADGTFNSTSKGGSFTADSRFGIGVEGIATGVGGGSSPSTSKGGYFSSAGDKGYGVFAIATNSTTQDETYGGYFKSESQKGIGVYGTADGSAGGLDHYGGYFRATGNNGIGNYSEGNNLAVHAKGKVLIEGIANDAILNMQSINGNQNRVIVLQDSGEDIFFGDMDGENRDVIFRSAGTNLVHLKNNHRVGISRSNPTDFFQIDSPLNADGNFRVQNAGSTKVRLYNNGSLTIGYNNGDDGVSRALQLQNSTNILLGNARANAWETHSDARIKSNGRALEYGLDEVLALKPKSYNHHSSVYDEDRGLLQLKGPEFTKTIGFYAQEVHEIIPEVVYAPSKREDDIWSMDYTKLIPVLTKAIQEQQSMIEKLQAQNVLLMSKLDSEIERNNAIEERLSALEK